MLLVGFKTYQHLGAPFSQARASNQKSDVDKSAENKVVKIGVEIDDVFRGANKIRQSKPVKWLLGRV